MRIFLRSVWLFASLSLILGLSACKPNGPSPEAHNAANQAQPKSESTVSVSNSLTQLMKENVGKYPELGAKNFLEADPIAGRLKTLLGKQYPDLNSRLDVVSPLTQEGDVYYISGNKKHEGGMESAAIVVDTKQDVVWVALQVKGKVQIFVERNAKVSLPKDIQSFLELIKKPS